jgi:ERCC4-type nuclease
MSDLLKTSYYFPLQVTIDDREPTTLEEEFRKKGNMIVRRQRLETGDYLLDRDLLVERKTITDFCQSIKDGRLFRQVKNLTNGQVPACLILEGKKKQFKQTDFSPLAIQGVLVSVSLAFRLPVITTKNHKETIQVILQSFKQLTKCRPNKLRPNFRSFAFKKKSNPLLARRIHILESFPGIGSERAEKLIRKFGSLRAVLMADDKELLKVPGFGKKTVGRFNEILKKQCID